MAETLEALIVLGWTALTGGCAVGGAIRAKEYLDTSQPLVALAYAAGAAVSGALMLWPYISVWRDNRRAAYSRSH